MGFVRVWWPPVVVGLVVAVLGIGAVEVAVMPAGGTPMAVSAPGRPQPRPASVAPAAIERDDVAEPVPRPRPTATARPTPVANPSRAAPPRAEPTVAVTPGPKPTVMRSPKPVPTPVPKPKPVLTPVPTPGPSPTLSSTAPPTAPPVRRVAPIVSPTPTPTPTPTPAPAPVRPAQVLDLTRWKLTLPTGQEGHPTEVRQPGLGSLASGTFARLTPDRGVAFRAPVGGVTTENSSYPRSELREMSADGRREAAWSSSSGRHHMTITQAITATPRAKPHVVAGQIHDAEDDVIMIRLEGGRLFVESDGDDVGLLDAHYRLGTRFTVAIAATRAGIRITYNPPLHGSGVAAGGPPGSRVIRVPEVGSRWYFKAGCYVQSNPDRGDRPTAYGEVVIYALTVQHS